MAGDAGHPSADPQRFADVLQVLCDEVYPAARHIHVVLDNLNIHKKSALYSRFEPCEARRMADKLVFHHTPKHGSWLNAAEIELSIFARQCTARRLGCFERLEVEAACWTEDQNRLRRGLCWHFTAGDARIKLRRLYPSLTV
ncbi:transposase [Deinococcus misasensis]|uniref:transposase n=1 Tax=Deinococcus misasensis TaxID=392413 RepID=UPI0012F86350